MKTKKYILLFFFIVFCLSNCKKYPEGPCISLRTKTNRIRGAWGIESFYINGKDSTSLYCNIPFVGCVGYVFGYEGHDIHKIGTTGRDGNWEFGDNKKKILVHGSSAPLGSGGGVTMEWEIQRLTHNEFWFKRNYSGNEYYLKLKKDN